MKSISFEEIKNLNISAETCINWAREVIKIKKDCNLPAKSSIHFGANNNSFFNTMPSYIPSLQRFGVKEVSRLPERTPALKADILLYDTTNGNLLSFMDGTWITTMRTGAVAAITVDMLKRKNIMNFSFIGLGNTARSTLVCLLSMYKNENITVNILAYKNQHESFMKRFSRFNNITFNVFTDVKKMISISDVVISCVTAADICFAEPEDYKPGVLVVPVHTRGFQNCDLVFDKIFCDDINHISGFKYFKDYKSVTEMTDVLNNEKSGRDNEEQRLLAYNIGISIQDIYFASKIFEMTNTTELEKLEKFWV